jgi:hypothetical protein
VAAAIAAATMRVASPPRPAARASGLGISTPHANSAVA